MACFLCCCACVLSSHVMMRFVCDLLCGAVCGVCAILCGSFVKTVCTCCVWFIAMLYGL